MTVMEDVDSLVLAQEAVMGAGDQTDRSQRLGRDLDMPCLLLMVG